MTPGTRRAVSIGVLTVIAAIPAFVLAGVWQYADANVPSPTSTTTTTVPPPPAERLATQLLSFRRQPTPLAERAAATASAAAFDALTGDLSGAIGEGSCLQIVDRDTVVAEVAPTRPVVPASNMKLLVAAVALDTLGPNHRFRTELQSVRPVGKVIPGDVYLVGGGDPVLRTADVVDPQRYPAFNTTALEPLADQLVTLGVTRIEGDIVGDGSRYDDEFRAPDWGAAVTSLDAGPYDALLVNDGLIGNGNYGLEPNRAAARIFYDLLVARGVTITGAANDGPRPAGADLTTLALVESAPLTDVLVEMLHTSDNNTAEMLVKEIGYEAAGLGTRVAGLDTISTTLDRWGVPLDGVELHDGSGLSRGDRLTCAALVALLADTPVADELRGLLPVAGRDGTLSEQFLGTPAEGRLEAKTGTLTDVKALSGAMPDRLGRTVEFALVLNAEGVDRPLAYLPIWNRLVSLIAEYPVVFEPDLDAFGPLDPATTNGP